MATCPSGMPVWVCLLATCFVAPSGAHLVSPVLLSNQRRKANASALTCQSSGGKPTSFSYSGCFSVSKIHDQLDYAGARAVTPDGCFSFCQGKWSKGNKLQFFGVSFGTKCWCGSLHEGASKDSCKTPCAGDEKKMCGGSDTTSVYVMFDCTPPTPEERKADAEEKDQKLLASYASFAKQTCGESDKNKLNVQGEPTFVGSLDDCKRRCYDSLECHGFTYQKDISRCLFHADVLDGKVTKKKGFGCYYKKLGLASTAVKPSLLRHAAN